MNTAILIDTARSLMVPGKGLLAMDESVATCNRRFAEAGIPQTAELRRLYRELLVTTPGLGEGVSGAILFDVTLRGTMSGGELFVAGTVRAAVLPGIKVDFGTVGLALFPGEKVMCGLDRLRERVGDYRRMGAVFARWRSVIAIGPGLSSRGCVDASEHALSRYTAICQEAGLVPIVEPEVGMDGGHDLAACEATTEEVLYAVFRDIRSHRVFLEAMLLKPNRVVPGSNSLERVSPEQFASLTVRCLRRSVPAAVAGVAFLSGGQPAVVATRRLNAMCREHARSQPWPMTFSFGRALRRPAPNLGPGHRGNVRAAQPALLLRVRCNSAAQRGCYTDSLETESSSDAATDRSVVGVTS